MRGGDILPAPLLLNWPSLGEIKAQPRQGVPEARLGHQGDNEGVCASASWLFGANGFNRIFGFSQKRHLRSSVNL